MLVRTLLVALLVIAFLCACVVCVFQQATPYKAPTAALAESDAYQPGEGRTVELDGGVTLDLVWIPSGDFMMGSATSQYVTIIPRQRYMQIRHGFWMGKYPVTQAQWKAVMDTNPSRFQGENHPVERVSYEDVQEFLGRLSAEGHGTFRLPTDVEWEYACRAGSTTRYFFGDKPNLLRDYAWYSSNSGLKTHPVGEKLPNAWGLYDIQGNVGEWCEHRVTKGNHPPYAVRGGTHSTSAMYCQSAYVWWYPTSEGAYDIGFRVVMSE